VQPRADTAATVFLVADDGSELVVGRVGARADLAVVDTLARIALAARRCGCAIRVRDASDELRGLVALAGLAGVLALEPHREAELGEQVGIEEVVEPGDAAV